MNLFGKVRRWMFQTIMTLLRPIINRAIERLMADPEVVQMIEDNIVTEFKAQLTAAPPTP
jgi:hypothetical protein